VFLIPRKVGQSVVIGDDIILTVVEVRGDKVRLQVEAPKEATVHRKEVHDALHGAKGAVEGWPLFDPSPLP
jgi:carbon storage regulator